jgi:phosphate starvation-inducible protein PhoH and related proteins
MSVDNANRTRVRRLCFYPQNDSQRRVLDLYKANDILFLDGPAGSGKTAIALHLAIELFQSGSVERVVISRPMVNCEEDIGYLPGSSREKLAPWLNQFNDVLPSISDETSFMERVEFVSLGMIKGRTFANAVVILDEAQDATYRQMRTFLSRIGKGSKFFVIGDSSQSDLPLSSRGAFRLFRESLSTVPRIANVEFPLKDVIRHTLISAILNVNWFTTNRESQ